MLKTYQRCCPTQLLECNEVSAWTNVYAFEYYREHIHNDVSEEGCETVRYLLKESGRQYTRFEIEKRHLRGKLFAALPG